MKTPINKNSILSIALLFLVLCGNEASGQSLSLFDVDASNFPTIRAKFYAFDAEGNLIRNLSPSDFEVKENGLQRAVTNVSCPAPKPLHTVSIAMSIDVSGSMLGSNYGEIPVELGKTTAKELCNIVEMPPSEFALQTCNHHAFIIKDFTSDKTNILSAIEPIKAGGGNDFVEQLLNRITGLLNVAKTGKNKRVAVLYTDAWWQALSHEELQRCKDTCSKYSITFYAVIYSRPEAEPNGIKKSLQELANFTGGYLYDGVTSLTAAKDIGLSLQQASQGGDPCQIEWKSVISCISGKTNVELEITNLQAKAKTSYHIPNAYVARLEFTPPTATFLSPEIGVQVEKTVSVTAINADFSVTNITSNNAAFIIEPTNFVLNEGESMELTVRYTPTDSSYNFCKFEVESVPCPIAYYAVGGYLGIKPKKQTLKLTHPNGGESFVVGSDTVITWEGIPPSDKVRLEYSSDNGQNWQTITKNASGLSYNWTNILRPISNQCLLRVSQGDDILNSDTNNPAPQIEWQKTYGGSGFDAGSSIVATSDGGYIVAGYSSSIDGDVTENKGAYDVWIAKLHSDGTIEWQKTYGGTRNDLAYSIQETKDGGYIVAGHTYSNDGDITENKGQTDFWVLKLSNDGSKEWQKTYGGSGNDIVNSIIMTSDGDYIVAGWTSSNNGDVILNNGKADIWILKLLSDGNIEWQSSYGGSGDDVANSIIETKDRGYIVAGFTNSQDGDVTEKKGEYDGWIIKLRNDGSIEWQKTYGSWTFGWFYSIKETRDGGYIVAGLSDSFDDDKIGNKGGSDVWVLKLRIDGSIEWQKTYGGSENELAFSIQETKDDGYIVTGYTESFDGDVTENKGGRDVWVLKLSNDGMLEWQKTMGGSDRDDAASIQETGDGGYIIAGSTYSSDGDVTENKGSADVWIVKLAGTTILQSDVSDAVFSIVEPIALSRDIDMLQVLVGSAKDSVVSEFVSNTGSWKFRVDSIYIQGADASAFSLVSGFPVYTIEPNDSYFGEFRFVPKRVGIHSAEIVIVTQAETIIQNIIGEGVEPRLEIANSLIDFGKIYVGEMVDTLQAVTVKNIGKTPLEILDTKHSYPNDVDFTTLTGGGNFILQPEEEALMDLRFTANSPGRTSGTLEFYYNGVGSPAVVQLFGEGIIDTSTIILKVLNAEGYAADGVKVYIVVTDSYLMQFSRTESFSLELNFNPSLLYPLDFKMDYIDERHAKIKIENLPVDVETGDTLATIWFRAGLGNAELSKLELTNIEAIGGNTTITHEDGTFKLLGICYDGGTRLFNPNSSIGIEKVSPNPAENMLEVDLNLAEEGQTELLIYNMQGEKVKELFKQTVGSLGTKSLKSDISDLSSGQYYLVLITPTYITTKNLVIMR
jgi:hypothetical protein